MDGESKLGRVGGARRESGNEDTRRKRGGFKLVGMTRPEKKEEGERRRFTTLLVELIAGGGVSEHVG